MRIYKTEAANEDGLASTMWASSKDQAAHHRKLMISDHGFRRDEVGTKDIDFKPTVAGILDMLNEHAR